MVHASRATPRLTELRAEVDTWAWDGSPRVIVAMEADTGKGGGPQKSPVVPLTLAVDGSRVVFHDGEKVVCLDRETGQPLLVLQARGAGRRDSLPWFAPTLVLYQDVVALRGRRENGAAHRRQGHYDRPVRPRPAKVLWTPSIPPPDMIRRRTCSG